MEKPKILVVDDDKDIVEIIEVTLQDEFNILKAYTGKDALSLIKKNPPDLIILDYILPDIDGPTICKILRQDILTLYTPILMLTGKGEVEDKVYGLESGADDYMVKPFSPSELLARVRMLIRRAHIQLDANPLTRLPGNVSITRELERRMQNKEKFAVLYLDIDNFKALNDYYGFERGNEVIKDLARIILEATQKYESTHSFIGHIGGDDFVVITLPEKAETIAQEIINQFDKASPHFFDEKDREKGYIETLDRTGKKRRFKFLTISIGITDNVNREFQHVAEISFRGTELKEYAKKFPHSKYIIDRRTSK